METKLGKSMGIDLTVNYFRRSSQPTVITLYFTGAKSPACIVLKKDRYGVCQLRALHSDPICVIQTIVYLC